MIIIIMIIIILINLINFIMFYFINFKLPLVRFQIMNLMSLTKIYNLYLRLFLIIKPYFIDDK